MGIFQILKNKASRSIFWISAIKKTEKIWHFCEFFHFYPTLDYHKIRTRTNFENPNGKNLDLHLIMWFTLKQLLPDSTDFTEAIFKMPQVSKHFSAMLTELWSKVGGIFYYVITGWWTFFCHHHGCHNITVWWFSKLRTAVTLALTNLLAWNLQRPFKTGLSTLCEKM